MPHKNIREILGDEHCITEHYIRLKEKIWGNLQCIKSNYQLN